jgi:DNA-binding HxlR family transcriptional regulator
MEFKFKRWKYRNKIYPCPGQVTMYVLRGKWTTVILQFLVHKKVMRFGEMLKVIPKIDRGVLSRQLNQLAKDGLIIKKIYIGFPLKVEYKLSSFGKTLIPSLNMMCFWGMKNSKSL